MEAKQPLSAGRVIRYVLTPGIMPRLRELAGSGFGWLAYMMALIYYSVRLLPHGHPYINPANKGKFGVRHVITVASNRLVLKWENIDQIIVFFALLAGFILLIAQAGLFFLAFFMNFAYAQEAGNLFATRYPENDIVFMMLDKVFAVPGMYGSKFDPVGGVPPFHQGLHLLFRFYNSAILMVGVLIFIYFVLVVVAETAMTGSPFGKRFNTVWAPLRLIMAVGLLVPLNYGLNAGQYIALYAAKYGSGLATNSWIAFNQTLVGSAYNLSGMKNEGLVAKPTAPDIEYLVQYMSLVHTCKAAYELQNGVTVEPYLVTGALSSTPVKVKKIEASGGSSSGVTDSLSQNFDPLDPLASPSDSVTTMGLPGVSREFTDSEYADYTLSMGMYEEHLAMGLSEEWLDAIQMFEGKNVTIRFGTRDEREYQSLRGGVKPLCGEIKVHSAAIEQPGAAHIQASYYQILLQMWDFEPLKKLGECAAYMRVTDSYSSGGGCDDEDKDGNPVLPGGQDKQKIVDAFRQQVSAAVVNAHRALINDLSSGGAYAMPEEIYTTGWGGAGIWYNHIAEWNGALVGAAMNPPSITKMPLVMEEVAKERKKQDQNVLTSDLYTPVLSVEKDGRQENMELVSQAELPVAKALNTIYKDWVQANTSVSPDKKISGNIFFDFVNAAFGTYGLFSMRENKDIHPMAQLVAIGKGIVDTSIRNMMGALVFSFGGGIAQGFGHDNFSGAMQGFSAMLLGLASTGLTIGFILFYILPFMPFMYFFFSISGWIKGMFEAMVGIPLWALAHLRIDGNGLPGDAAMNGYYLVFEIFIRPILTVFGLIASVVIFTAQIRLLNEIFDLVTTNLTGFDCMDCGNEGGVTGIVNTLKRDVMDQFFFTILYTVFVYMIATTAFKLIDLIPQSILRWMGSSAQTFSDMREDPTGGLVRYAAIGGSQITQQVTSVMQQGATTLGFGLGAAGNSVFGRNANQAHVGVDRQQQNRGNEGDNAEQGAGQGAGQGGRQNRTPQGGGATGNRDENEEE